ncbi:MULTISPECIES: hypothetical protein [unclassified Acidocella]|uniref:hypothetical protein n=1 Tax=unclassified Acidocella TaxID=2648610 RepID=UPI00028CEE7F|nr:MULTISPECIES: hypothetical protein [unclassified Acidocella]EKM98007.1 hypothetical protein MXAZACID_17716 [Acidocella sp. MX-AZ02]WBO59429.1 hypothetical protein GT370_00285 [Acidocella sp. MX-AZ03]
MTNGFGEIKAACWSQIIRQFEINMIRLMVATAAEIMKRNVDFNRSVLTVLGAGDRTAPWRD